jgi:hypothetical protein
MGEKRCAQGCGRNRGNENIRKPWGRQEVILKRILNKYGGIAWTGLIWLRTGMSVNTAKNFQVPENERNFWTKED